MDELMFLNLLSNNAELFENEFNGLNEFYNLNNEKEIHDFIKSNPGLIILLNAYQNSLKKYFSSAIFELKFKQDLSGNWFDLISLIVWLDEETFNNGSIDYIYAIDRELRPLRKKLDLLGEICLTKRILR